MLPKHELNGDTTNAHVKVNKESPGGLSPRQEPQATEESWKTTSGRDGPPQRRTHQLAVQGQTLSPENIHTSNTVWTEQVYLGM